MSAGPDSREGRDGRLARSEAAETGHAGQASQVGQVGTTTSPAAAAVMMAAPRWCARLGFCRDLWAGRARVVADSEVEASLREPRRLPGTAAAMLAELVPERANTVWLLAERPGDLAGPRRRGVHPLEEFDSLLAQAPWEVAIVELGRFFVETANLSRFAARARGRLENRLDTRAFRLLSALSEGAAEGRTVILTVPAASRGGLGLGDFQDLLEQHFPRSRVYALAPVPVAVVVDCGEVVREEDDEGDSGEEDDDSAPSLAFDNRMGEDLRYDTYLALVNAPAEPEGVTLVELPAPAELSAPAPAAAGPVTRVAEPGSKATHAAAEPASRAAETARASRNDAEVENLRIQLGQARRQVELAAIARQSLVEQLDAAQARVDNLEDQIAEQQRRSSDAVSESGERRVVAEPGLPTPAAAAVDPRPDATQATILGLRWELEQTRDELRKALGRPVDELERELATLRARLGISSTE